MSVRMVAKYVPLTFRMWGAGIRGRAEYRASFLMQSVGMIVNDIGLLILWVVYFQRFPEVNGWKLHDTMTLLSIATMGLGMMLGLTQGARELSRTIAEGSLDIYLTQPKNILWNVSVAKVDVAGLGDVAFGFGLLFMSGPFSIARTLTMLLLAISAFLISYAFVVITQSLAFWVNEFQKGADSLMHLLIGFTLYPQSAYSGALRVMIMTIIPAYFVGELPVSLLHSFTFAKAGAILGFSVLIVTLASVVFNLGLRRYESGNKMTIKL